MSLKITSKIITENDTQKLVINGKVQEGIAYITYLTKNNCYQDFAEAGYKLFSVPVFFGNNYLNEHSKLPVFTKGIFDEETPDFNIFDEDINKILKACPEAYILPRVNVSPSRKWEESHLTELLYKGNDEQPGRVSFASDMWSEKVKSELSVFMAHVKNKYYAEHIAGYQIAGGNTEEWLPFDVKGLSGMRAEEKFAQYIKEKNIEPTEAAYFRFVSETVASRIAEFAAHIKKETNHTLVVGTFYGYTLECPDRTSGHHDLRKLLECDDIDFISSPVSYSTSRLPGKDHPYMLPLASVKLHNKLYFSENDTRTHLSRPVNEMPHYNSPIWFGHDRDTTLDIIKMHAARALIYGHACWWFDMWGGWFKDSAYMELMGQIRELFQVSSNITADSVTETAVFVDEEVFAFMTDSSVSAPVCAGIRETLGKMGAPYHIYLASDAEAVIDMYKAIISLVPQKTANSENVAEFARKKGKALLEITAENVNIAVEALRGFLHRADVHLYSNRDAVVYANDNYIFLHTAEECEYNICPLHAEKSDVLWDVFENCAFEQGKMRKKGESFLLKLN